MVPRGGITRPAELTDLLVRHDPITGARDAVLRSEVLKRLEVSGQHGAAAIAARLPAEAGIYDLSHIDELMVRVHLELQRLGEELQLARRVAEGLTGFVAAGREDAGADPIRVVDVGCGLGYVIRWLAAHRPLGPNIELVGVDFNDALIEHAQRLAELEGLECRFVVGNALAAGVAVTDPARTIMVSTGLLHHLAPLELVGFFAMHEQLGVSGFAHWDIRPGPMATIGAWVFHRARMREAVSRHDGVLSARRAHRGATLAAAAATGAPSYDVRCDDRQGLSRAFTEVLRPVTGTRRRP